MIETLPNASSAVREKVWKGQSCLEQFSVDSNGGQIDETKKEKLESLATSANKDG